MTYFLDDAPADLKLSPTTPDVAPQSFLTGLGATFQQSQLQGDANMRVGRLTEGTETDVTGRAMQILGNDTVLGMLKGKGLAPDTLQVMRPDLLRHNPQARAAVLDMARSDERSNPDRWKGLDLSQEGIDTAVDDRLQAEYTNNQQLIDMSPRLGVSGMLADLAGGIADVRNLATLIPGLGDGSFLRVVGREAMLNVGAEAISLPGQEDMAKRLGMPAPSIAAELATAATAGALFGGIGEGVVRGLGAVRAKGVSGAMTDLQRGLTFWKERAEPPAIPGADAPTAESMTRAAEDALSAGDDPFSAAQAARGIAPDEPTGGAPMTWDEIIAAAQRESGENAASNPPDATPDFSAIAPHTDTAIFQPPANATPPDAGEAILHNARYQAAKAYDPQTFAQLEDLSRQQNEARGAVTQALSQVNGDVGTTLDAMNGRIKELLDQHQTARPRDKGALMAEIRSVERDRKALTSIKDFDTEPEVAAARRRVTGIDEKMRDLAPAVGKAFRESAAEAEAAVSRRLPEPERAGPVVDVMTGKETARPPTEIQRRQKAATAPPKRPAAPPAPEPSLDQRTRLFSDPSAKEARVAQDSAIDALERQVEEQGDGLIDMGDGRGSRSLSSVIKEMRDEQAVADLAQICGGV